MIGLEDIERGFVEFWNLIGAEGELDSALAEFGTRYNAFDRREPGPSDSVLLRGLLKLKRLGAKLPRYIRDA